MIAQPRPRSVRRAVALAALGTSLAVASWTDVGALTGPAGDGAPPDPGDDERQALTVQRSREIGVAMMSWLTDVAAASADMSAAQAAAAEGSDEPTEYDWSRCPAISYDELAAVLVPIYLDELPRNDGWGHPFEYCLDREHPGNPRLILGLRSPGRDGRWQGDAYPVGGFPPDAVDRDLVWIDGFFITWPLPAGDG